MTRNLLIATIISLFVFAGCAGLGGPEGAARSAFEEWATTNGIPFQNVQVSALDNDGTFATVRVVTEFRSSKESPWVEQESKINCRKVG